MSGGASLGVQALSYGLDKGYDRLPSTIFLTPKERKERKRQWQQQQQEQAQQGGPQQGHGQQNAGYQDQYPQDPRQESGYSPSPNQRQAIDDHSYYQADRGSSMQGDGYYQQQQPPGGRRSYNPQDYQPRGYGQYDEGYGMVSSIFIATCSYCARFVSYCGVGPLFLCVHIEHIGNFGDQWARAERSCRSL